MALRHLTIERIEYRNKQTQVKAGFVKMQLVCRDAKSETGKTPVFFQVKAADKEKAIAAAGAKFKIGQIVAARSQDIQTAENAKATVWQYYSTSEEALEEAFLNNEAAQMRLAEAKAKAAIATPTHSEEEIANLLS